MDGAREALCKSGAVVSEVRYSTFPFQGASRPLLGASRGEMRYLNGETVTDLLYTSQKLEEELGLYYYVARWSELGRFVQADNLIPDSESSVMYDRYAYTYNNPICYSDPTGHYGWDGGWSHEDDDDETEWLIICGIGYFCTGDQSGQSATYGVPAYPGWEEEIEKIENFIATFMPTPPNKADYDAQEYANQVPDYITSSTSSEIDLICHSRGGQTCTQILLTSDDERINEAYFLDPSAITDTKEGAMDTVNDIQNLFATNNNVYLIVGIVKDENGENKYTPPGGLTPSQQLNFDQNGLVYVMDTIFWILNNYNSE